MSKVETIGDFAVNLIEQELESPTATSRRPFTGVTAEDGQSDISEVEVPNNMLNKILAESFSVEPSTSPEEEVEIPEIDLSTPEQPEVITEHAVLVERFEGAVKELTSVLREMTGSGFVGGGARTTVGMISPNFEGKPKRSNKRKKETRSDQLRSLLRRNR
tara:strand:+ start:2854 stop:3336 length:483 start_codon:yes stop_codon:yes gene_type:complete